MSTQDMTGATHSRGARTSLDAGHRHDQPSARALAARSWSAVRRLDGEERAAAAALHFDRFAPSVCSASCRR